MKDFKIIETTVESVKNYGLCGYKNVKRPGYAEKLDWIAKNQNNDLTVKVLYSKTAGTQGMIEYIDGEYCWRPIEANDYLFIHCLFVGFKKKYKNLGLASKLLDDCLQDAIDNQKNGVAVLTRKGSFMAKADIFIKNGFELVDQLKPDFKLLVKKVNKKCNNPIYKDNKERLKSIYSKGLFILRSDQCPYTVKNVGEMVVSAEKEFKITPTIINITDYKMAQLNPSPFGNFALIYNGKILSHHPISRRRFENILRKEL